MTFIAVKPIDGSQFGGPIAENTENEISAIIEKAAAVAHQLRELSPAELGKLLRAIAAAIESERDTLIATACAETALPEGRIGGEITRTTVQFIRFAELVETGEHLRVAIDKTDPN